MYYRVKHVNLGSKTGLGDLISFFFWPLLFWNTSSRREWWEVQCKNHWWNPWETCISQGGIMINGSDTKEEAIEEMNVLKKNGVGYYDFHFDYKNHKFYIKEKFDTPRRKMKTFNFEGYAEYLFYGCTLLLFGLVLMVSLMVNKIN